MNKGILFMCVCFLIGCSNKKEYTPNASINSESSTTTTVSIEDAYTSLIKEKIQDHIDNQKIKQQYPNFKKRY